MFWWVEPRGSVVASPTYRSRFRFDAEGHENGTVILGKDAISIFHVGGSQGTVAVQDNRLWANGSHNHSFHYSDLKKIFLSYHAQYSEKGTSADQLSSPILVVENGHGEEWELVQ